MSYSYDELIAWNLEHGVYPMTSPDEGLVDYHRAQIERWLWDNRDRMVGPVIDIGAEWVRGYAGYAERHKFPPRFITSTNRYRTLNNTSYETVYAKVVPDIEASITKMPFEDGEIGTILCTEVLEHVPNLFRAVAEIQRVLEPGGWVFISVPFIWPTHDTENYGDFWRITEQGLRFLFHDFAVVDIHPISMRHFGKMVWAGVVTWEVMGNGWVNTAPTGYCMAARKAGGFDPTPKEVVQDEDTAGLG